MAKTQPGIMLYKEMFTSLCSALSAEEVIKMLGAALDFEIDGIEPEREAFSQTGAICWSFIRPALERDAKKYRDTIKKRKEAAESRWGKGKGAEDANDANASSAMQTMQTMQTMPTTTPTPTPSSSSSSTPIGQSAFAPPTLEEVEEYVLSIGGEIFVAERFYDACSKSNWYRRGIQIKNWQALVASWVTHHKNKAASQPNTCKSSVWGVYESF